jgi:tRNA pseudouridine32 synthase/23S rRNA pseudouridine746 synthase
MPLSNIHILHQDAAVLVVNKPTLLLSVPGRADDNKDCLITRLQENGYPEARIVHRLDWETSGIILLARDADTHRELSRQFHDRETEKAYTALAGVSRNWTAAASTCRCATTHRPSRATWSTMNSANTP